MSVSNTAIKHNDQENLQKEVFNWAFGFRELEFMTVCCGIFVHHVKMYSCDWCKKKKAEWPIAVQKSIGGTSGQRENSGKKKAESLVRHRGSRMGSTKMR